MGRYLRPIFFRFSQLLVSLVILVFLCLGLLQFFPGSPFVDEKKFDPAVVAHLENFYGLNQGLLSQFTTYLQRLLQGDLGQSMHYDGRSVQSLIFEHGVYSLQLGGGAFIIAVILSLLFSLFILSQQTSKMRKTYQISSLILLSIPSFVLGPVLIWLFAFHWDIFPSALLESPASYILPLFLLSFKPTLTLTRTLTAQLESVMKEKYIQTAKAMGFSQWSLLTKWALKNALLTYFSQLGFIFAYLISGSLLVEILFAVPGLGQQFVESILNRDWTLVMGLTLFYGALLMLAQFVSDLMIALLDPRVESL